MKKAILFGALLVTNLISWGQAFGPDVIIKPDTLNQQNVEITTAFNGWLFSAVNLFDEVDNKGGITISKSIDGGLTWTVLDQYLVTGVRYPVFDIVVTGTDEASLKVFLIGVNFNPTSTNNTIFVDSYNGQTGSYLGSVFNENRGTNKVYDVEIASDYKFPAAGAAPYSVGFIFSSFGSTSDSIVSVVSLDGGVTFSNRNVVATTVSFFRSVSLDYGRSTSASNGRYFAAWEQLSSPTVRTGHVYTSRNSSTVDGPWITPENLDSLSGTMIHLCRNPRIAVQQNDFDNDSASVTALVTVERDYNGDASDYDVLGFYNKRAHFTNFWYRFDIINAGTVDLSADVIYEDVNKLFHVVYLDSTDHALKYVTNTMQFSDPDAWTDVETGMNDTPTATKVPNTRIAFRPTINEVALAWIDNASADGVAKFDIESFVSVGIDEFGNEIKFKLYPNPTANVLNIETLTEQDATITIFGMDGTVILKEQKSGFEYSLSVENLNAGMYLLQIEQNGKVQQQQFVKQ